jgi:two-component system, OmpR family, phosphate regulon response regulator OmpR
MVFCLVLWGYCPYGNGIMYAEQPHILVIDDDDRIRDLLFRYLVKEKCVVAVAEHAQAARELLAVLSFDLIICDVMMPGQDGMSLTADLRGEGVQTPILLLTAMGEVDDRIRGLQSGADDYLAKPFDPRELMLRVQAILRRRPEPETLHQHFKLGDTTVDLVREELRRTSGEIEKLTLVELKLLRAFVKKPGEVMSRDELAALCGVSPDERTIDVQITRLRRRLGDLPRDAKYIQTVRGQGYRLMIEGMG